MMKNITTAAKKSVLVKPATMYTKSEAKAILGLSEGSALVPSKYTGMGGRGKVPGTAIIAYLERSARVKVGRRYPSGTVSVVAR